MTKTERTTTRTSGGGAGRSIRAFLLAFVVMAGLLALNAPSAAAGEMKSLSPEYSNGKCSKNGVGWLDLDCYHDDKTFARHSSCRKRMGQLAGVDPESTKGRIVLSRAYWLCQAQRPSGRYLLQIYHPTCPHVGWSSAQCRAWAKGHR